MTTSKLLAGSKRFLMANNTSDSIVKFNLSPWNENFPTGTAVIDQQHQRLVEVLNRLARRTVSGLLTKSQP